MGTWYFVGAKWPEHVADLLPLSNAGLRTSTYLLCLHGHIMGRPLPLNVPNIPAYNEH